PADVGFTLTSAILVHLTKVEFLTRLERHVGFTLVAATAFKTTKAFRFTVLVKNLYGLDFNLEQLLYSGLDFRFCSISCNTECDLLILLSYHRGFFSDDWSQDDLK